MKTLAWGGRGSLGLSRAQRPPPVTAAGGALVTETSSFR